MKIKTLGEALERIDLLERENEELRAEVKALRDRKMSGRKKHNAKWMSIYNDFIVCHEAGMSLVEIAKKNEVSERTMYRYKAFYEKQRSLKKKG